MALILKDRVQETATANTTVSFSLAGASTGYTTFSSTVGNTNTTYYGASDGTNWEVGIGTYATTGNLLTRTTILASSNAGSAVTFSGTVTVFIDYPSSKSVYLDASGNASALGTPASGVVTNLTGTASININGTVGATTASTGAFTTLSASSTVSGTGFSTYLASPPAIGGTAAAAGTFTQLTVNGSNLNTVISPSGTGTVAISPVGALTINPTAASTINNASIGATTASTGRFTSVTLTTTPLAPASGGIGITTTPTNGQIPIGNGTNYTAAALTQGTGISVTNASGSITITNTGTLAFSGAGASITTSLTSTGLTAALGAGTYRFTAMIYGQSSSAAGGTFQIAYSGTTTSIDIMQQGQATGTSWVATNRQTAVNTAGTVVWTTATTEMTMLITGVIVTGTAGTFTIDATKTTSGTLTIRSGSNLLIG